MEIKNVNLRVHKVHRKNNGAHTVGMVIESVKADGMKLTKYASVKYTKRPKVGTITKCKRVVIEENKEKFWWITDVE